MRVFISYRRADLGGHADALVGRIYDRLSTRFGQQNVCVDVETIPAGEDFAQFIRAEIAQADAVLAVTDYGNLAAFFQNAPTDQHQALWRVVGRSVKERLVSHSPLWLSVAGGGVAWLHVRLDSSPKYYRYGPYRIDPDSSR